MDACVHVGNANIRTSPLDQRQGPTNTQLSKEFQMRRTLRAETTVEAAGGHVQMEGQPELHEARGAPTNPAGGRIEKVDHQTKESFWDKLIPMVPCEQTHQAETYHAAGFFWDKHREIHKTLQWMQDLNQSNKLGKWEYNPGQLNVFDTTTRSAVVEKTELYSAVTNRCLNGRSQREEHRVTSVIVELKEAGRDGQVMVAIMTPSDRVIDIIDEITQDAESYVKEGVMEAGDWELKTECQIVSRCKTMPASAEVR